jgi:surface antigen
MRKAELRTASLAMIALVPIFVAGCGVDRSAGSLLGAFSSPEPKQTASKTRTRASSGGGSGAVIGGIGANGIGRAMSTRERGIAADAEYRALEYGQSGSKTAWSYPAMNHRGTIVPGRPYKKGEQYCRTYTHTVHRGGSEEVVKGVACREDNGTWRGVS